jgi:hypothetical protein
MLVASSPKPQLPGIFPGGYLLFRRCIVGAVMEVMEPWLRGSKFFLN